MSEQTNTQKLINLLMEKGKLKNKITGDLLSYIDGVFKITNKYGISTITDFNQLDDVNNYQFFDKNNVLEKMIIEKNSPLLCYCNDSAESDVTCQDICLISKININNTYTYYAENVNDNYKYITPIPSETIQTILDAALEYEKLKKEMEI